MANTTNTQQNRGQETVKNVRTNVVDIARELQSALAKLKQQASVMTDTLQRRKIEFAKVDVIAEPETIVET
ncbi:MAG: hypothetical protein OSJ68_09730, partial [Clostridia bacterium]|nr:hypothetical protein [Clostridia bacterium]